MHGRRPKQPDKPSAWLTDTPVTEYVLAEKVESTSIYETSVHYGYMGWDDRDISDEIGQEHVRRQRERGRTRP
ncbi:hypothetical protein VTO73DRAFT_8015 [Trametes versicolor]